MMNDKEILSHFNTGFCFTSEEESEVASKFPQYILYRRNGKEIDGYCTGCKQYLELEGYWHQPIKHGLRGRCPNCDADITFYAGRRVPAGRGDPSRNFVLFRVIGGDLYIRAVKVYQRFTKDGFDEWNDISDYDTAYDTYDYRRYYCTTGAAVEYLRNYYGDWVRQKSINEPSFSDGMFGNSDYYMIGADKINDSCLKYSGFERYAEICGGGANYPVKFLCMSAKYPVLEKLMKSGFEYIVRDKVNGGKNIRLNYRGGTPQKILRLNTDEVKALRECNAAVYNNYLYFRKTIRVSGDFKRKFARFEQFGTIAEDIVEIANKTGLSHDKIMNYIERQIKGSKFKIYAFAHDWQDYLRQCAELDYDITDEGICKPSDFQKMHERLSKLYKLRQDEIAKEQFRKCLEIRRDMEYVGERYIVIQPQSIDEIVAEGKALEHCVGGYADRHIKGILSIMFLRMKDRPQKPYYTIEVSNEGKIVQCRGYRNNWKSEKPKKIEEFEIEYQRHLDKVMAERKKKARRKKPVLKQCENIGA